MVLEKSWWVLSNALFVVGIFHTLRIALVRSTKKLVEDKIWTVYNVSFQPTLALFYLRLWIGTPQLEFTCQFYTALCHHLLSRKISLWKLIAIKVSILSCSILNIVLKSEHDMTNERPILEMRAKKNIDWSYWWGEPLDRARNHGLDPFFNTM